MRISRAKLAIISLLVGVLLIALMHFLLPDKLAVLLLDRNTANLPYPLTIQNIMWLMFTLGLGELWYRRQEWRVAERHLHVGYLPEDENVIIQDRDIGPIYGKVKAPATDESAWLPRLIHQVILQFQSSRSIEQANSLLNSQLELFLHQLELKYSMIRYLSWLIPTLGFIGTVFGISVTLAIAGAPGTQPDDPNLLPRLTAGLAVAFNTTLLALVQSAVLVFLMHLVEGREERTLNQAGQYCLNNLVNRLYVKQ